MKYLATIVLIITLGGLTLVKQVEVEAPKTETSNSGEVSLNVQVPDITSATPEVKVTSEPSSTPESTSVVDNVLTAVKKVAIKEGETTTVVVAPAPPTPIVADETTYTPITDFCFNISGNQLDVPSGYSRDQHNNCWPVPVEPTPVEPAPAPTPTPEPEPTPPADTTAPQLRPDIGYFNPGKATLVLYSTEKLSSITVYRRSDGSVITYTFLDMNDKPN